MLNKQERIEAVPFAPHAEGMYQLRNGLIVELRKHTQGPCCFVAYLTTDETRGIFYNNNGTPYTSLEISFSGLPQVDFDLVARLDPQKYQSDHYCDQCHIPLPHFGEVCGPCYNKDRKEMPYLKKVNPALQALKHFERPTQEIIRAAILELAKYIEEK